MNTDGEIKLFAVVIIAWASLIFYLERREVGKPAFDRKSDIDKYKTWMQTHYWGAYLFCITYGLIRLTIRLLFGI